MFYQLSWIDINIMKAGLNTKDFVSGYAMTNKYEDFAESFLNEIGAIPNNLTNYVYIDWERTARDLMFDFSSSGKHYFRSF